MAQSFFTTAPHAALYAKFRPSPPTEMINRIVEFLKLQYRGSLECAVDVGCGNGQSTCLIAPLFKRVLGTDVSQAQIAEAIKNNQNKHVSYRLALAEEIPAGPSSVQLITASQAAHWFDLGKFYGEVDKKLAPNGVLAIFGYSFPQMAVHDKKNQLSDALDHVYSVETSGYWGPGRKDVDDEYKDILIPYEDKVREEYFTHLKWSLAHFSNYLTTWSGYQNLIKDKGEKRGLEIIQEFESKVKDILGTTEESSDIELPVSVKYFLLMGRKPAI